MTLPDPNLAGYSEAAATVFTWLADRVLGGAKKALGWGWERAQWAAAQDRYDEQIIKQHGWIRIFGQTTPKPLREVFTDVYVLDKPTAFTRFDPEKLRRHLWEQDRGVPIRSSERLPADQVLGRGSKFFILGKPGAGKTTLLKYLAVREAQRGKWGPCLGKIPIFIPLKQFSESGNPIFDFIVEQFAVCHFPDAASFVDRLLKAGKTLLLFDGLDEVPRDTEAWNDRRGQVTEQIEQFARQYDGCHIVVTCRIAATEYMLDPPFIYLELADFAPDQVEAFVRNWFWDENAEDKGVLLAERMLMEWAKPEHEGIRDLGRNPLLLTLLCLNYAETLSFPARRVEIYQESLDALLKKWDASRQIQRVSLYKTLSLGRKQQMFSRIAYDYFVQDEIVFAQADLETRIKTYVAHAPEVPDIVDIDAEAILREIVEQHGIFVEQSRGVFSFAHLTFQEHYTARYISENATPELFKLVMARVTDDKWRDVFLETAALLPDATRFLSELERTLQNMVASRQRVATWLRHINQHVTSSTAGYSLAATRLVYLTRALDLCFSLTLIHERVLALACALDRDFALDLALAARIALDSLRYRRYGLNLERDCNAESILAFALGLGGGIESAFVATHVPTLADLSEEYQRRRKTTLHQAISSLVQQAKDASDSVCDRLATELLAVLESHSALQPFRQLEDEASNLVQTIHNLPQRDLAWDLTDLSTLVTYIRCIELFHRCLLMAYTPDRRAFEDRILLPPPLTKQEA